LGRRGSTQYAGEKQQKEEAPTEFRHCWGSPQSAARSGTGCGTTLSYMSSKIQQTNFAPQRMVGRFAPPPARLPASKSIKARRITTVTGRAHALHRLCGHARGHKPGVIFVTLLMGGVTA